MTAIFPGPAVVVDGPAAARLAIAVRAGIRYLAGRDGATIPGLRTDLDQLETVARAYRESEAQTAADRMAVALSRDTFDGQDDIEVEWLSTTQAARFHGWDRSYWRRAADQGDIEARKTVKGHWRIEPESAERWAATRRHTKTGHI